MSGKSVTPFFGKVEHLGEHRERPVGSVGRVALRVVRNLRLADNADVRAQWQEATQGEGTIEQWLIALFRKNLAVQPSRESSVITVAYTAPDPRFAAGLANAFVEAYTQTSLELRVDPARQFSGFFDTQLKEHRERLEAAQARLSSYQKEQGIIANDERLDVETQRLNELSSQYVALQAVAAGSVSRQVQARGHCPLQIEGQTLFGATGQEVQVAAHRPEEVLAFLEELHFLR